MKKLIIFVSILTFAFTSNGQVNFNENILFNPSGLFIRGTSGIGFSNIEISNFETHALTSLATVSLDYYFNRNWNISGGLQSSKVTFNDFEMDFNKIKSVEVFASVDYNYHLLTKTKIYLGIGALHNIVYNANINSSTDNSEIEIKDNMNTNTLFIIEGGLKYEFLNPHILHLSFSNNHGLNDSKNKGGYNLKIANQILFHVGISFKL